MVKIKELLNKQEPWYFAFLRDFILSLLIIGIILGAIYLYSGVWPPLVAVESGSMEPHIDIGDVVFIVNSEEITTYRECQNDGKNTFGAPGEVIIYKTPSNKEPPIIHRAMYWVEKGEPMWENGPLAPHSGYITKGDNNEIYDQKSYGIAYHNPIKKEWIIGKAKYRIPFLGKLRLLIDGLTGGIHHYNSMI